MNHFTINDQDETNRQKFEENVAQSEEPIPSPTFGLDSFDWDTIVNDVYVLRGYGVPKQDALKKVVVAFRYDFSERLGKELKARSSAHWKEATFKKLREEFEQEEI